jgi:5-methylcytosine-specific restriction enzyme subunit McrC
MKRIVIPEYGQIVRWRRKNPPPDDTERIAYLEEPAYRRLEKCEHSLALDGKPVFTFYKDKIQVQQWVGIVQIPGLQIEILPKVDTRPSESRTTEPDPWCEVRGNLLYMLDVSGDVPVRTRDMARLATRRAPLNETLGALFANALLGEILRGCERNYITFEENLRRFKGRLLVGKQLLKNAAHRERFYCRFDEFSGDTVLNRIFKAASRILLDATQTPATQDKLRHCLLVLDEVSDVTVSPAHFDRVTFSRQNERFEDLFHFCRMIIGERAPAVQAGAARSFSLLFDMNKVFERFIAAFLHAQVMPKLPEWKLYPQARNNCLPLFQTEGQRGVLPLAPDILICHKAEASKLVIDTKWKRLSVGTKDAQRGVLDKDLYQLYAYTQRFGCAQSVLLYPQVSDVSNRDLYVLDDQGQQSLRRVSIRFVNVNRNLYSKDERIKLADELEQLVREGIGLALGGHS